MTESIQPYQPKEIAPAVQTFSSELVAYLDTLGLPKEKVLIEFDQRRAVINNVPAVVSVLTPEQRQAAMYISKFIAASAVGLFDAALNYLWNETIRNLREKVAGFDLEYFFDSVITDPIRRSKCKSDTDLEKLDDWELIKGCLVTGIITEIGYRHLDYIRDMRNWASAAHPNQNELTGLQVISWLETCIKEVLGKEPTGPVVEVRRLLRSLRVEKLSQSDIAPIAATLPALPDELSRSLLRTIVGMYTDVKLASDIRNNIKLVAGAVWDVCSDESRYEAGLKYYSLEVNGEVTRAKLAREFLDLVGGLVYLPPDRLGLEITSAVDSLMTTHNGWNNFNTEPAPARLLQKLVPVNGQVPDAVVKKYIKAVTMGRIGNGYGISWAAEPIYDDLISRFSDKQIFWFTDLVNDPEFVSRLRLGSCSEHYKALATELEQKAVNSQLKQTLKFIIGFPTKSLYNLRTDSRFKQLRKAAVTIR